VIREGVTLGRRCVIQSNAVIGSEGFGYARKADSSWYPIAQLGTVVLEDEVDVGAGSTIDRPTLGRTIVGQGTKIDNLVHIGHACEIGRNSLLCAQVGLAGSTIVGSSVILAGQAGVAGHLTIGDGATVGPQSGIPNSIPAGKFVAGSPAVDHAAWLRYSAVLPRLPEIRRSLRDLVDRVESLERQLQVLLEQISSNS
jgi:UDP-3-O-[3-hydroxymyristoyl] glucosamine N-acyltransferase